MKHLEMIKEQLLSMCNTEEESLSEIKRYADHFPKEPDFNIVQYGNLLVYYDQIHDFYRDCGYEFAKDKNNDEIWEMYKKHVGLAANQLLNKKNGMTNEQKIVHVCNLDGNPLSSVYVIEALRTGLQYYLTGFSDEEISQGWGFLDSPAGVRAKMRRILDEINKK